MLACTDIFGVTIFIYTLMSRLYYRCLEFYYRRSAPEKNMEKRFARIVLVILGLLVAIIVTANYVLLQHPMSQVLKEDARNDGIQVFTHFKYFVDPTTLVYDLRSVSGESSPMDVTRVLLKYAERQQDSSFSTIELSHQGTGKFLLQGDYFKTLGKEFKQQNPAYTLRTLPENILNIDGSAAFGTWTGGMLGVFSKQLEDFSHWHREWYISDLTADSTTR